MLERALILGREANAYGPRPAARALVFGLAITAFALGALPGRGHAQRDDAAGDEARARGEFEEGVEALQAGRFALARDRLRSALELSPRRSTALNLATALRGTGETTEALRLLAALRAGTYGALNDELTAMVETLDVELRPEVSRLEVEGQPGNATLLVDGQPASLGQPLDVDAGDHVVVVRAEGFSDHVETVSLERGQRTVVTVSLEALPAPSSAGSVVEEAWFWILLVGLAAAAGVGIGLGVFFGGDAPPNRIESDVYGTIVTLRLP